MNNKIQTLPPSVPAQISRATQAGIPGERGQREALKKFIKQYVDHHNPIAPLADDEIKEHVSAILEQTETEEQYSKYVTVLFNNACWYDTLATIPYERRLLLLPKCLRVEERCPAPFDEFGLLCKQCGLCTIQDLEKEAHDLGYAVLVAEGSTIVMKMIETNKIEAIVGVSCISVLEKAYPYMEAAAIPGVAIPLLQDDCKDTTVDVDWVWDVIHLTSDDTSHRLDLDALHQEVQDLFTLENLELYMGTTDTETQSIAYQWLSKEGKRWRPYLTACVAKALEQGVSDDLKKVMLAVECFHKASLIHDDIEDGDDYRYEEETLHKEQGIAVALNVGDYLLGEGYRLLAETNVDSTIIRDMIRVASQGHRSLSLGQGAELCWANHHQVLTVMDVLEIFKQKTAPAFEVALRLGALFGEAEDDLHRALTDYSENLGIAYQIQDDIEDYQIQNISDLEAVRPSLIFALAYESAKGEDKETMSRWWHNELPSDQIQRVRDIVSEHKIEERCIEILNSYKENAIRSLKEMQDPSLKGLMRRVIGKIFNDIEIKGWCSEFEKGNVTSSEASEARA